MAYSFDFAISVAIGNVVDQEKHAWTTLVPLFSVWLHLRGDPQFCRPAKASLIIYGFCGWFRRTARKYSIDNTIIFIFSGLCAFQAACSPTSAFASFSKHPASPPKADRMNRRTSGVSDSSSDTLASNIPSAPHSVPLASYSPAGSPLEGDVVIPCEFCGVLLEEAVVFHHQVCQSFKFSGHCRRKGYLQI